MVTLLVGRVIMLTTFVPTSGISPATAVLGQGLTTTLIIGIATGLLILGAYVKVIGRFSIVAFISELALEEELWFRLGSERWNRRQRFASCVAFGFAHLVNLIYVFATLGMLAVVGAIFMLVYLHELRRGSSHQPNSTPTTISSLSGAFCDRRAVVGRNHRSRHAHRLTLSHPRQSTSAWGKAAASLTHLTGIGSGFHLVSIIWRVRLADNAGMTPVVTPKRRKSSILLAAASKSTGAGRRRFRPVGPPDHLLMARCGGWGNGSTV